MRRGLHLLHAIRTGAAPRHLVMVDGFHVAELMRMRTLELFDVLTRHASPFIATCGRGVLQCEAHVTASMPPGRHRMRYNDRCLAHRRIRDEIDDVSSAGRMTRLICDPQNQFQHQLQPGEVLVFDNQRSCMAAAPSIRRWRAASQKLQHRPRWRHSAFRTLAAAWRLKRRKRCFIRARSSKCVDIQ